MLARISAAVLSLVYVDKPESVFFPQKVAFSKKNRDARYSRNYIGSNSIHRRVYDRKLILRQ